jgi:hypothetical protein
MSNKFCRDFERKTRFYICNWRGRRQYLFYIHACFYSGRQGVVSDQQQPAYCEGRQELGKRESVS